MDTKNYQGQKVTVVRAARQGDEGYNAKIDQSVIRTSDGTEKVVTSSDIT